MQFEGSLILMYSISTPGRFSNISCFRNNEVLAVIASLRVLCLSIYNYDATIFNDTKFYLTSNVLLEVEDRFN